MTDKIIPVPNKRIKDMTGQRFGRLVVDGYVGKVSGNKAAWLCRCDCGRSITVVGESLRRGHTTTCGCLRNWPKPKEHHGMVHAPEYAVWTHMIQRCTNPARSGYKDYGGRGITVCKRWRDSFQAFYEDIGQRPGPAYSLDRIDPNGNYEPDNCRWATAIEQANNTRYNRRLTYNGESLTIAQWARRLGMPQETLYARLNRGLPVEEILTTNTRYKH
jgi:hypothetical protein